MFCVDLRLEWAGRSLATETAQFGAQQTLPEHHNAEIVLAEPLDGSITLTNANAEGKIVLVERGSVPFVQQAMNAQNAGATAVIIFNNQGGGPITMGGDNSEITLPVVSISQADGAQLAAAEARGRTSVSLQSACHQFLFNFSLRYTSHINQSKFKLALPFLIAGLPLSYDCMQI